MGCVVVPGSPEAKYIEKAWAEGRIVPMNNAARKNAARIYEEMGVEPAPVSSEVNDLIALVSKKRRRR